MAWKACSSLHTVASLLAIALTATPTAIIAQDQIELRFADWLPTTHDTSTQGAAVFIDKVKELSGGQLEISHFPSEQLGKAADSLRLAEAGVADIVNISPAYVSEKFPLSGVAELPNIYQDACEGSNALMQMVQPGNILEKHEYSPNGVRVLFVAGLGSYRVLTANKPVRSAADFAGLKLRTAGGSMDIAAEAIGATSVRMPGPDVLTSLSRGTLDGVFWPLQSVRPWGLQDNLSYMTPDLGIGSFTIMFAISERSWQKLSSEQQQILIDAGRFATEHHCTYTENAEKSVIPLLQTENGIEPVALPDPDLADLRAKLDATHDVWAAGLDARRLPGTETLAAFRELVAD